MKTPLKKEVPVRAKECGQARIIVIAFLCFVLGVGAGAFWFSRPRTHQVALASNPQEQTAAVTSIESAVNVAPSPQAATPLDPAVIDDVKRAIPNVTLVSFEQGTLMLRKAALAEFQEAAQELQARQKKAEQSFIEAQGAQSAERQLIAANELQQLQAEQMETLKKIAADSEARINALKQLKGHSR